MLLELYPFQTELFCIARPRMRSEASFFCRFLRFWCVLGDPAGAFLVQIVVKKVLRKKSAKLSENGSRNELGAGPAGSLKQENRQLQKENRQLQI